MSGVLDEVPASLFLDELAADFPVLSCFWVAITSTDNLSFSVVSSRLTSLSFPRSIIPFKYWTSAANATIINKKK